MAEPQTDRIPVGYCPECDTRIRFHTRPRLGQQVTCRECGEVSEVIALDPVELDWVDTEGSQSGKDSAYRR